MLARGGRFQNSLGSFAKGDILLQLQDSTSSYKAQLAGIKWHAEGPCSDNATNLSHLFFGYGEEASRAESSMTEELAQNPKVSPHEHVWRKAAATSHEDRKSYNSGQVAAHSAFLETTPERLMILHGPAGTGKTETISERR